MSAGGLGLQLPHCLRQSLNIVPYVAYNLRSRAEPLPPATETADCRRMLQSVEHSFSESGVPGSQYMKGGHHCPDIPHLAGRAQVCPGSNVLRIRVFPAQLTGAVQPGAAR